MLNAVAELTEHAVGNVQRVLRHKIDAHALGPHEAHHQLDALDQHFWRFVEQQVGLVEEEHQLGLFRVADFGQLLKQLGQHPQQEGGVEPGRVHQLVGRQDVHHALAVDRLHEVTDVEHGLAKELVATLLFDLHQATLDGADAGRADVAVFGGELFRVVSDVLQHGPKVFHVEQEQAVVVGDLEHQVEHAGLRVVEVQHARQQQRPHVAHGRAHRVALFAEHVPQRGGTSLRGGQGDAAVLQDGADLLAEAAHLADAGEVAFDVGHEDRHADVGELFRQCLQAHGLAGSRGAGDQAVPVGQPGQQLAGGVRVLGNQHRFGHGGVLPVGRGMGEVGKSKIAGY
ncbi:hypothetical protein Y695_02419 [Hydrogenophaga sp. T4]|nr:hypothetical protein Y695_02419 [Hydrogenophaga sp. T4]